MENCYFFFYRYVFLPIYYFKTQRKNLVITYTILTTFLSALPDLKKLLTFFFFHIVFYWADGATGDFLFYRSIFRGQDLVQ